MTTKLLTGQDVDDRLSWPAGRAELLARKRRLPHLRLPDGAIRFDWIDIEPLIDRIAPTTQEVPTNA